jgi:uncharacterized metal-binding protein
MDINWKAPFEIAFELGLFLVGSLIVVIIVGFCLLLLYAIIKTFFQAFARAKANVESGKHLAPKKKDEGKPNHLKPIQ